MSEPARDNDGDRSKASFKLDLIETVNADPALEASDLKLIAAYAAVVDWPSRQSWLSTSRARAMTGLSERQVSNSRARLAGGNVAGRVYLSELRRDGLTTVYRVDNPWLEDHRQHVAIMTEHFRGQQKERQAERRRLQRDVPATVADTSEGLSQSLGERDVPATVAGNIPSYTPQKEALKEGPAQRVSSSASMYGDREDDPHRPFPVPTSQEEAVAMLDELRRGANLSAGVLAFFRNKLWAGELTPAMVEQQRREVAA